MPKCLGFESKVQLLKELKQSAIHANEMCEKAMLEKSRVWRSMFNLLVLKKRK
jgi:hypothetical protein